MATLYLSDGTTTVTVLDGGAGDMSPTAGVVTYSGAIGVWVVNVTTGISQSPFPQMHLNSVDMSNAAGTLTITFADTDFSVGAGPHSVPLTSRVGAVADPSVGSMTWQAGFNASNVNPLSLLPGSCCDQQSALYGPLGPGPFAQTNLDTFSADGPFALELTMNITHTGAGTSSFDYDARVPGPATLLLLSVGLLASGAMKRRAI